MTAAAQSIKDANEKMGVDVPPSVGENAAAYVAGT